jgi:hypothetical protein
LNLFDPINVSEVHQKALLLEKTSTHGPLGLFNRGGGRGNNRPSGPFTARNTTQPLIQNKVPTTTGERSRARATTRPKCFRCGELGHWMADCRKGDKYGKGLRIDLGEAFDEQGDKKEQEATFDNYGEVNKEFCH